MASATILDGKKLAESARAVVRDSVIEFEKMHRRAPGLDVVIVGDDPASLIYTRNKEKMAKEVGMRGALHAMPADTSEKDLLALIDALNRDAMVDGILVQLPLPKQINAERVLDALDPGKDVDGFHPVNAGLLASGRGALVPCTPRGCMKLIELSGIKLEGARAVVVGRSNIVGKPVAQLLLQKSATVTIAHSKTRDLRAVCKEADVLVAAVGRTELIKGDFIKEGAVVIDVGINRIDLGDGKSKLKGDVAFDEAEKIAGFITPVPGGVGPLTIACLLENTLTAARQRVG